ncbi:uncharacterized protein MAM_05536 [Metarhizium album ARSEF 1941]|uniref:Uncharacterized protein n=1 Tax=Metarhizium album (strain ARSEF 1941) TaxID=1081103 RepID=A0A0B2WRE8_METAS|nr:uncharacterized protein MAM_05536 [Metarhizium album ARSEF 1941]KHN96593.1 hypothetical protein MAM_05536 [Metarhizium album ARSEF 1941]
MTTSWDEVLRKHGIRRIPHPTKDQVRKAYVRADANELNDVWQSYITGRQCWHPWDTYSPPDLEIVCSADIRVYHRNSVPCDCGHDLAVERLSVACSLVDFGNYAGYDSVRRCYAFRGQRRLLDDFLGRAEELFDKREVKMALVAAVGITIPFAGFPSGWKLEEFAMHAETMMCILFLASTDEDPLNFEALALASVPEKEPDSDTGLDLGEESDSQSGARQHAAEAGSAQGFDVVPGDVVEPGRYPLRQRKSVVHG